MHIYTNIHSYIFNVYSLLIVLFLFIIKYMYISAVTDIEKVQDFWAAGLCEEKKKKKMVLSSLGAHSALFLLPLLPCASSYSSVTFDPLNTTQITCCLMPRLIH